MIVVPSRFAGLRIVEDDYMADKIKAAKKADTTNKTPADKVKKAVSEKSKSKQPTTSKSVVNGPSTSSTTQNEHSERKKKRKNSNNAQWEEWKQKDTEIVDEKFQDDLMKAIKLSSMEYDSQISNARIVKTDQKPDVKEKDNGKKNKKNKPLTLSQFAEVCESEKDEIPKPLPSEHDFTNLDEQIQLCTEIKKGPEKKTPEKEHEAKNKLKKQKFVEREPPSLEQIKQSQLSCSLEVKDLEINRLKEMIEKMKSELALVKNRNKQLCNIIGQGEMKAKANLLLEMEEVKEVHAELNSEMERLNAQLQQERSRCTCTHRQEKRFKKEKKHMP